MEYMKFTRSSGILMHPTSFSGTPGIGTLGNPAYEFVDWLESAHQTLWQILPIGPTGYGDSPYASFSTFAGNPLLIDLDDLVKKGWASKEDIIPADYIKSEGPVEYGSVVWWKMPVLFKCASYFLNNCSKTDRELYEAFKNDNSAWLNNYADFTSIKQYYDSEAEKQGVNGIAQMWNAFWPKNLAKCDKKSVSKWDSEHTENIEQIKVIQFFFNQQWFSLKEYANKKGIKLIGDIPIFVAPDSADVWANQKFFQLDENGIPLCVAGVPPDYFSATGQLWGNPLYDWDAMKKDNYSWWVKRIKRMGELVDIVRIDHFRGFEAYWSIPYGEPTAVNGKWVKGPDIALFNAIKKSLGELPIIAEDLGVITDDVRKLRDDSGFPGMKVLQFAFDPNEAGRDGMVNAFLPHMYPQTSVVYTGTHDNDTLQGWLDSASDAAVKIAAEYAFGKKLSEKEARTLSNSGELCSAIIRCAIASCADMAVIPMQDILDLGKDARMNTPNTLGGTNWAWRIPSGSLTKERAENLSFISDLYGRNIKK